VVEHKLVVPDTLEIDFRRLNKTSSTNPVARCKELLEELKKRDVLINSLIKTNHKLSKRVAKLELRLGV